jgi:hypothetical protein
MNISTYTLFKKERKKLGKVAPYAPYEWQILNNKLPIEWFAYSQFMQEHTSELANSINELNHHIGSLMAWEAVMPHLKEKEHNRTIINHVSPIATLSLLMPYAIRSRFIYSVAHLSHQANMLKINNWVDDLPVDTEIYFKQADEYGREWSAYSKLKISMERIANKQYSTATHDFRHSFNHRYSPRIELGLTGLVTRIVTSEGAISYGFGETEPLKLKNIIPVLQEQHHHCINSYEKYQILVNEQSEAINQHITAT